MRDRTLNVAVSITLISLEAKLDTKSLPSEKSTWIGSLPTGIRANSRRVPVSTIPIALSPRKAVKAKGEPVRETTVKSSQAPSLGKKDTLPSSPRASIW